jgi:DNA-binding NarL/FixJ family response regulator
VRTVTIVDRQPIFARGLATVLSALEDLEVIDLSGNPTMPAMGARPSRPGELLVVDEGLFGGPDAPAALRRWAGCTRVLLIVASAADYGRKPDRWAWTAGCIDRGSSPAEYIAAVRAVQRDGRLWSPDSMPATVHGCGAAEPLERVGSLDAAALSPRERQVMLFIAQGKTHDQVARQLGISRNTVDTYVKRIRSKIGMGNKADMTRAALASAVLRAG